VNAALIAASAVPTVVKRHSHVCPHGRRRQSADTEFNFECSIQLLIRQIHEMPQKTEWSERDDSYL